MLDTTQMSGRKSVTNNVTLKKICTLFESMVASSHFFRAVFLLGGAWLSFTA